ncbi:unnamed protein product [Rotaria sordida]|uniref:Ankyrin repeat protein n=1 Tax=Rotaria sordida TaxID=392033 RepID=A0A815MS86_9BILA|nr:unnamed protein product [Rotaria sordida]CAF4234861.1 unnamed protein product [Rotaria sordida]
MQDNRLGLNGSTSLHAASFYDHKTIVQILLVNGAKPSIINRYKMTSYKKQQIHSLFHCPLNTNINHFADDDNNNCCLINKKKKS